MSGAKATSAAEERPKAELLAPAGDPEKLRIAVAYGADAVYFGGESFSLRAGAGNFRVEEIREAVAFARSHRVKSYLTLNIYPHEEDLQPLKDYLVELRDIPLDGFIVSDPGVIRMVRRVFPDAPLHLSTQANVTNGESARFWYDMGVRRLVLARELSLEEIRRIREAVPDDMELEAFVHGAMCISYSGRCLLSNFMTGRDANRGACAHPCRYRYRLEEEKRPGRYWPVEEDDRGTYIFNSNDLCMLEHLPDLIDAGVTALKIEGRMKSIFYVAHVVRAYRQALDACLEGLPADPAWMEEMAKASHRRFSTGFYYHPPGAEDQNYETSDYTRDYVFCGLVLDYDGESGTALVEQRNRMVLGDTIEFFGPAGEGEGFAQTLSDMRSEEGEPVTAAPHPQQILKIRVDRPVSRYWMLRKEQTT